MRDMRIALSNGYEMKISENQRIRIADEAGRGAGCIVYNAIYWDQMQIKHKIRVPGVLSGIHPTDQSCYRRAVAFWKSRKI